MQTQRAITHVLSFVLPQKDALWRLNWYNEVRIPMLASTLLSDEGRYALKGRLSEMIEFVKGNPT